MYLDQIRAAQEVYYKAFGIYTADVKALMFCDPCFDYFVRRLGDYQTFIVVDGETWYATSRSKSRPHVLGVSKDEPPHVLPEKRR